MVPPPVYPRPVSPLCAESYHFHPQDVIYASSSTSSDDDVRAIKRRRIEKLGEQYLRGDGLHILSAGLKGPFDKGWKNPWAKQKRDVKSTVLEIPETARPPVRKVQAQKIVPAKATSSKVEDWLRRNSAYCDLEIAEQTSPTPPYVKLVNLDNAPLAKQGVHSARDQLPKAPKRSDLGRDKHSTVAKEGWNAEHYSAQLVPERPPRTLSSEFHENLPDPARIERRAWVSPATITDRAEFAALKSKRRTLQIAPPSTVLSPFEYRRVSEGTQKLRNNEEIAGHSPDKTGLMVPSGKDKSIASAIQTEHKNPDKADGLDIVCNKIETNRDSSNALQATTTGISVAVPALSTETSRASLANLPSAQPRSLVVLLPSTNDLAIDEVALEQPMRSTGPIEATKRDLRPEEEKVIPPPKQVDNQGSTAVSRHSTMSQLNDNNSVDGNQTRLLIDVAREDLSLDTQEMLAGMSPMAFSTIKKATIELHGRTTPVTATKRRPGKPANRTSCTQGERVSSASSQGSLKSSLRVSKGPVVAAGKENKLIKFGEEETHLRSSDVFTSSANASLSPKRLKSALKPSGPLFRTVPFPSTKGSTSTGVDGGQNPLVPKDETFDLDGAIDDLGSYLGTWDAEKEASSLAMET